MRLVVFNWVATVIHIFCKSKYSFIRRITWTHKHGMCLYVCMYTCIFHCAYLKHRGFGLIFHRIAFLLFPYIKGCFDHGKSTLNWNSKRVCATNSFQSKDKKPMTGAEERYDLMNGCNWWESQQMSSSAVVIWFFPEKSLKRKQEVSWAHSCLWESLQTWPVVLEKSGMYVFRKWLKNSRIVAEPKARFGLLTRGKRDHNCHLRLAKVRTWGRSGRWNCGEQRV